MGLTTKVLLGVILGAIIGMVFNQISTTTIGSWINYYLVDGAFYIIGQLFVNALKMLVVPIVFFSLICGVCAIGDIGILGRVGGKAFILYLLTTGLAISLALLFAANMDIGQGLSLSVTSDFEGKASPPLSEVIISLIPTNPLAAMVSGDMLSVIFFTILFGIGLLSVGQQGKPLITVFESANEVMMKVVLLVMQFAPYAVLVLVARSVAELGFDLLLELAGYVIVLVLALLLHLMGTLMLILVITTRLSPRVLLKKMRATQLFAFSTASSNATIPVTLKAVTQQLGVNRGIASFTVPFGATINMDGTAIMQGVATVFIANLYGIELGMLGYLTVVMMSVLASIGTAGVPGVGLIMLSMVFVQVGIPVEGIGLILGVDRLMDMLRTAVNVTGDAVVSVIVADSEQQLNKAQYYQSNSA